MAQDLATVYAVTPAHSRVGFGVPAAVAHSTEPAAPPADPTVPVPQAQRAVAAEPEDRLSLESAVAELARRAEARSTNLQFRIDDEAGRLVVSLVDAEDGKVLRQFPSEVVLRIAQGIDRFLNDVHLIEETV
jgi:flagellar protein FlaG